MISGGFTLVGLDITSLENHSHYHLLVFILFCDNFAMALVVNAKTEGPKPYLQTKWLLVALLAYVSFILVRPPSSLDSKLLEQSHLTSHAAVRRFF